MAIFSDAEKKAFIDRTIAGLAEAHEELVAAGWDPGPRIQNLQSGVSAVASDENLVKQLGQALKVAVDARRNDLENSFNLARLTASLLEGVLGAHHGLVASLNDAQIRLPDSPAEHAVDRIQPS